MHACSPASDEPTASRTVCISIPPLTEPSLPPRCPPPIQTIAPHPADRPPSRRPPPIQPTAPHPGACPPFGRHIDIFLDCGDHNQCQTRKHRPLAQNTASPTATVQATAPTSPPGGCGRECWAEGEGARRRWVPGNATRRPSTIKASVRQQLVHMQAPPPHACTRPYGFVPLKVRGRQGRVCVCIMGGHYPWVGVMHTCTNRCATAGWLRTAAVAAGAAGKGSACGGGGWHRLQEANSSSGGSPPFHVPHPLLFSSPAAPAASERSWSQQ